MSDLRQFIAGMTVNHGSTTPYEDDSGRKSRGRPTTTALFKTLEARGERHEQVAAHEVVGVPGVRQGAADHRVR